MNAQDEDFRFLQYCWVHRASPRGRQAAVTDGENQTELGRKNAKKAVENAKIDQDPCSSAIGYPKNGRQQFSQCSTREARIEDVNAF